MTYILLNMVFISIIVVILMLCRSLSFTKQIFKTLFILLALTAIFDSLLIALGFFYYDSGKLLGLYVGKAPLEDFFYPILAVILVPGVWKLLGRSENAE